MKLVQINADIGSYVKAIIEFIISQSPNFIIAFLALVIAGLAVFGLIVLVVFKL